MYKIIVSLVTIKLLFLVVSTSARTVPSSAMLGLDQNITLSDGSVRDVYSYISDFIKDYQKLQARKSKAQMKQITTAGILSGIISVEDKMKMHLSNMTKNLLDSFAHLTIDDVMGRLVQLEETMDRDKKAIAILNSALDFARNGRSYDEYVEDIAVIAREVCKKIKNKNPN